MHILLLIYHGARYPLPCYTVLLRDRTIAFLLKPKSAPGFSDSFMNALLAYFQTVRSSMMQYLYLCTLLLSLIITSRATTLGMLSSNTSLASATTRSSSMPGSSISSIGPAKTQSPGSLTSFSVDSTFASVSAHISSNISTAVIAASSWSLSAATSRASVWSAYSSGSALANNGSLANNQSLAENEYGRCVLPLPHRHHVPAKVHIQRPPQADTIP